MKTFSICLVTSLLTLLIQVGLGAPNGPAPDGHRPDADPASSRPTKIKPGLLQPRDLRHLGAFRLPLHPAQGAAWKSSFAYGGTALAYNPKHHSLFLVGHDHHQLVAEVSIPRPVRSDSLASLPLAKVLQPFADVTGGLKEKNKIGGLLVDGDHLLWTSYVYYDANASARTSHGLSSLELAHPEAQGLHALARVPAGAVAGPMCRVPEDWRKRFGVPVLTGQAGIPIVSRTSAGPAAVGFDPDRLGQKPAPTTVFLYYPLNHPLGTLNRKNELWNLASKLAGMAFVSRGGRAAVLFFGTRGLGEFWYGEAEAGGKKDPYDRDKGTHAPPYEETVWFYDPNDLLAVKKGQKPSWQPKPYHVAKLPGMYPSGRALLGGAAYDAKAGRLYVAQVRVDRTQSQYEPLPVIHVYEVAGARSEGASK